MHQVLRLAKHPQTKVLSKNTGFQRDYSRDPYQGYEQDERIFFPVAHEDPRLSGKDWVLGIIVNDQAKAYPFDSLPSELSDKIAGQKIRIVYDPKSRNAVVRSENGEVIPSVQAYWFIWKAFYPDTELRKR